MITFFILVFLYFGLLPWAGFHLVKSRVDKIGMLRALIDARRRDRKIYEELAKKASEMNGLLWDFHPSYSDVHAYVLSILGTESRAPRLNQIYHEMYGYSLLAHLRHEMDHDDFKKAYEFIKNKK